MPPLDDYLNEVCDRIQTLHRDRLIEMKTSSAQATPLLQKIRKQTPVSTELSQIVRAVKGMHDVVNRLQMD
ncbi:MAG: hypothetical protein AAF716_19335 [Cyanobacteria bacterium P01_D01_bin.1]